MNVFNICKFLFSLKNQNTQFQSKVTNSKIYQYLPICSLVHFVYHKFVSVIFFWYKNVSFLFPNSYIKMSFIPCRSAAYTTKCTIQMDKGQISRLFFFAKLRHPYKNQAKNEVRLERCSVRKLTKLQGRFGHYFPNHSTDFSEM